MDKKTPLYDTHLKQGGKLVSFAGYLMPIQYPGGIIAEHKAVREQAGIFDVSHMGELFLEGRDALKNLNYLFTNEFDTLEPGKARYTIMCYEDGTTVDDLIVYCFSKTKYLLVVNASNKDKDVAWIKKHLQGEVVFSDRSDDYGIVAIQGPNSHMIMQKITDRLPEVQYSFIEDKVGDYDCLISATGYTGESGYEVYTKWDETSAVFDLMMDAGQELGLMPCGLGSRDTLRLEAGMPLYGNELSDQIKPTEAGLKMFVKLDKADFIGKEALSEVSKRKKIGLELIDRGIARTGYPVFGGEKEIGFITSGTLSPSLNKAIAVAIIDKDYLEDDFYIDVRGRKLAAKKAKMPFYRKKED